MACGFCGHQVPTPTRITAPDGSIHVEEVIGWRAWGIKYLTPDRPVLESPVFRGFLWMPEGDGRAGKGWVTADCKRDHTHDADSEDPAMIPPVKSCNAGGHGCGFYAGRSRDHLVGMGYGNYDPYAPETTNVIGTVQMQGKIIPATNGWRAAMCRPRKIEVPYEAWQLATQLERAYGPYGVEIDLAVTTKAATHEWCPNCGAMMKGKIKCPLCKYRVQ